MDHFMACHINDKCEAHGHPSILQMMIIGMPAPNKPCRNCREMPETSKMYSSTEPETPLQPKLSQPDHTREARIQARKQSP